ncbi:MAG: hypothetical protein U0703_04090 [Anaerolineae bacterium]
MTQPTHLRGMPLPNLSNFLANRKLSMLALAATVVVFVLSLFVSDQQAEWLYRDNGIVAGHLQIAYALLIPVLVLVLAFEPAISRELRDSHALALLAFVGMCASFLIVRFIKPDQAWRFFRAPGILWFVIAHGVLLCALAVLLALDHPDAPASARTRRYALVMIALGGLVTLALHVFSVGEFMSLDLDDEVWLGSLATNLVSRGAYFSSANAGAFGSPDPLFSRYYLLMAEWICLIGNSSLVTLRAFAADRRAGRRDHGNRPRPCEIIALAGDRRIGDDARLERAGAHVAQSAHGCGAECLRGAPAAVPAQLP